jgi:hypothetical protein
MFRTSGVTGLLQRLNPFVFGISGIELPPVNGSSRYSDFRDWDDFLIETRSNNEAPG